MELNKYSGYFKRIKTLSLLEVKIILYFFLSRFWAVASIWVLFLATKGYSMEQIAVLDSSYFIAIFLFEVPTGIIADKFGRKISIIFSMITKASGILWLAFAPSSIQIFLAFLIWGIGMTMSSGAEEAWLYDEIKSRNGKERTTDTYQKIYGLMIGIGLISTAIANTAGGFLFEITIRTPIILTSIMFVIAALILVTIPENKQNDKIESTTENTKFAIKALKQPQLILLTIISVTVGALVSTVIYWMQPFLKSQELRVGNIGLILGIGIILASVGSSLNKFFTDLLDKWSLVAMIVLFIISFFLMPFFGILGIFLLFFIIRLVRGAFNPYMNSLLNNEFESDFRATALSIISGLTTLSIAFTLWITGKIIDQLSFSIYYYGTTAVLVFITLPVTIIYKQLFMT